MHFVVIYESADFGGLSIFDTRINVQCPGNDGVYDCCPASERWSGGVARLVGSSYHLASSFSAPAAWLSTVPLTQKPISPRGARQQPANGPLVPPGPPRFGLV